MFKPTRGLQRPSFKPTGINHNSLIRFLESAKLKLEQEGETESAFRFECMIEYFKQDYSPGEQPKFTGAVIGF